MRRAHLLPLAVWTALWAAFFGTVLLGLARLPDGDFSNQFHAFGLHQAREMAAGRLPLWSAGSYSGFPFAADTQSAVFYPPRWLTVLLSLPWGFPYYALELEALLHVWLAGVLTYFLAYDMTGRREAALLAAAAFGLGGYLVTYPLQQLAILETIAWLPLVLLLIRRETDGRAILNLLAAALVFALALYAGHPQTALHAGYLAAAYYLFRARQARWSWQQTLGRGALVAVVALGVSAAAWLPALRYAAETTRADVGYDFVSSGFPLIDYAQALVPGTLTLWSPQFIGLAGLVLVLLAWRGRGRLDDYPQHGERLSRAEIGFWVAAALLGLWLSLGDAGVLFEAAYRLPGFSLFRQQERLVGVYSLSMALLTAQGLALWLREAESRRDLSRPVGWAVGVAAAGLLVVGLLLFAAPPTGWGAAWGRQAALLGLIAAVLFGLRARPRLGAWMLVALLALELFVAVRPTAGLVDGSPAAFWPRPAWLDALVADAPGRIDSQNQLPANVGEIYAIEDIRGISPLKPAAVERYETLPRRLRWQLLNVTHVLAPEPLEPGLEPLAAAEASIIPGEPLQATLYRFTDPLPRAWFAGEVLVAPDDAAVLTLLQQPGFDPAAQVVLGPDAAAGLPPLAPGELPMVTDISRLPRGLTISYDAAAGGLLVISEWERPGWRLTLEDGRHLTPLRANAGLMAVVLPAGSHTLRLDYAAPDVRLGLAIAGLTLLLVGPALWRGRRAAPRSADGTPPQRAVVAEVAPRPAAVAANVSPIARLAPLVALLLVGFALRVFLLGNQELRGDEAFNYLFARLPVAEVVPELLRQGDPHPPLPYLALSGWTKAAGESEFALRYLSVAAGVLLLSVVYALGRRIGPRTAGLLAAALAAVSPSLIWLSQDARLQYQWMPMLAALATLLLVAAVDDRGRARFWVAYALAAAATMYNHYYGIFPLLAHGLYVALSPGWRRALPRWIAAGLAAAALLAPWLLVSAGRVFGAGHVGAPGNPELARHLVSIGRELVIGQSLPGRLGRWLAVGGAALALVGGATLLRDPRRRPFGAMLLGWVVAAAFGTFLIRFTREVFNPYYLVVAAPAWWLLVAAGIDRLRPRTGWWRVALVAGLGVWGFAVLSALSNYYFDPAHSRSLGYRDVATRLAAAAAPGDLFVTHFPDPVWDYYLREVAIERSLQPATLGAAAETTTADLEALAATHDRLWIVPYAGSVWDPDGVVTNWLAANALLEAETTHNRQRLLAYRPLRVVGDVIAPAARTLDGRVRLLGSAITVNGLPVSPADTTILSPGDKLAVTLVWEALEPVPTTLTVFVHLAGADGPLLAQHDGTPADGRRPTDSWRPGETILDRHELTVPVDAAGPVRLIAGMYDPVTIERLRLDDGTDAALLLETRVGP